jgi:hypothetical protein
LRAQRCQPLLLGRQLRLWLLLLCWPVSIHALYCIAALFPLLFTRHGEVNGVALIAPQELLSLPPRPSRPATRCGTHQAHPSPRRHCQLLLLLLQLQLLLWVWLEPWLPLYAHLCLGWHLQQLPGLWVNVAHEMAAVLTAGPHSSTEWLHAGLLQLHTIHSHSPLLQLHRHSQLRHLAEAACEFEVQGGLAAAPGHS